MPNIPGGNTKSAEGAQGMSAAGPTNVFPFTGDPSDPNLYTGYDLALDAHDHSFNPPGHGPTLSNGPLAEDLLA